jgi:hypothetical protein
MARTCAAPLPLLRLQRMCSGAPGDVALLSHAPWYTSIRCYCSHWAMLCVRMDTDQGVLLRAPVRRSSL